METSLCDNVSKVHTCTQNHNPCSFCSVLCNKQFDLVFYQHLMALKAESAAFFAAKGHSLRALKTIRFALGNFFSFFFCTDVDVKHL